MSETSRISHVLDNWLKDGGEVSALRAGRALVPRKIRGTHFCYSLE
jgi:hypothetical protein